jgi:hypothetical protein
MRNSMIACALALAVVATPGLAGAWNEPDRFRMRSPSIWIKRICALSNHSRPERGRPLV